MEVRRTRRSTRPSPFTRPTSPGSPQATTAPGRRGTLISGVAPNAYLGNYKALTIPTPDFGLDGNSAEIAAAIEAAVADGMNVINLSLGEPEVEPSRDLVVTALEGAAAAGVVPVIAAGNDFSEFGYGSVSSPGNAPRAITVAAARLRNVIAELLVRGADADLAADEAGRQCARRRDHSRRSRERGERSASRAERAWRPRTWPGRRAAQAAASVLDGRTDQVGTRADGRSGAFDDGAEALATREGGGMIDLPRADVR